MAQETMLGIFNNMALLLALCLIFETFSDRDPDNINLRQQVVNGIFLGMIGIAVMISHWHYSVDFMFDTVSVLVGVTGLFFGPVSTVILWMVTVLFRFCEGGDGMPVGILIISVSAIIGIAWRRFKRISPYDLSMGALYAFGLSVHAGVLICILSFSKKITPDLIGHISLPLILIFPLGTLVLSKLISNHIQRKKSVTGLLKSNKAFEESENRLRTQNQILSAVLDYTHMRVAYLDPEFNFIWVNLAYAEADGRGINFLKGKNHFDVYPHEENKRIFQQVVNNGESFFITAAPFKYPGTPERGMAYWDWSLVPIKNEGGTVTGLVLTLAEATERIKTAETLRLIAESSIPSGGDVFRFLVEQLAVSQKKALTVIARIDPDDPQNAHTLAVWKKDAFIDNFSYALKGTPCYKVSRTGHCFYPENVQQLFPEDAMLSEIGAESFWGTPLCDHSGNTIGLMAVIDIHPMTKNSRRLPLFNSFAARAASELERKKIQDSVSESENKYRLLFQNLNAGFALHEILMDESGKPCDYRFLEINEAFEQLTGLKARNTIGKTVLECFPGTEKYWIETYGRVAVTGKPVKFENFSKELNKHFTVTAYSPEKGRFVVIFMDVTDIRKTKHEQKRLSIAIEQIDESVVLTDTTGIIQYANPAFETITGFSCDEVLGQTPRILKSGHQRETFYQEMWATILSGRRWKGRIINKKKDGGLYTTQCSISPVKNSQDNVVGFVWISRDITKEVDLEKRMIQSQKMEAIGALAGGIAHDFNNILFPLVGWAEMISEELPENSVLKEPVNEILSAAKRARNLVQQILTFSRQAEKEVRPLAVQIIVKEVLKLIRSSLPSTIIMEKNIDPDTSMVLADPTQIHQILMNLTTNAFHAMEESGGTLFVGLENAVFNNKEWVRITVSDTGIGIRESAVNKIFDPYFTTKDASKGTGLGLSVVHGAVKSYGGEIVVDSKPGLGTRFDIYLPIYDENDSNKHEAVSHDMENGHGTENLGGNQHILVIDDEENILLLLKKMLGRHGYEVHTTNNGLKALALFKAAPFDFDLVIMDMTMPGMTGDKLSMEMLKIRPDLPIIICSGYNEKQTSDRIKSIGVKGMLEKPILKSDLLQMVNSLLDNAL